jgi:predicted enzyme related to lactoylglutathione lyase
VSLSDLRVCIDVNDLDRAISFYTSSFGLTVGRTIGTAAVELVGAQCSIDLLLKPAGSAASNTGAPRSYKRHWTPVHLDFVSTDLDAQLARVVAAGGVLEGEVQVLEWGRLAILADPFGHGFCLLEFSGGGYDDVASS